MIKHSCGDYQRESKMFSIELYLLCVLIFRQTQKMVHAASLLNTQQYKVGVKWSNPGKGVAPSPTPRCSSYRKGCLRVTFD